jgi:predicted MPP superfamily phosphohydrolase
MQRPQRFVFFGFLFCFIFITNAVVYEAVASIFNITATAQLIVLGAALGILSASFIAATWIGSNYYNIWTRTLYIISATWMGAFVYIFLGSVIYGLLALVPGVSLHLCGIIIVLSVMVASAYALVHARQIRITHTEVALRHLPQAWEGKRVVWISDIHLGQLHGPRFGTKIVSVVNSVDHDIVFIGGDMFDGTGAPDIRELAAPFKLLAAPLGTYFITGNHEEYGDSGRFISEVSHCGIRVLQDELVEIDGLQIIGVDYRHASDRQKFADILTKLSINLNKASILLKHEPKDIDIAHAAGVSLQISGHTHRAQLWPLRYVAEMSYRGFVYGLNHFKEMQVYTSSGVGTWGPPMRLGSDSEVVVITLRHK